MAAITHYIQGLLREGRHHFTIEEAVAALGRKRETVARALARLKAKGELASPQRGYYLVVPPEYHALGCLPAEHFVPLLLEEQGKAYYAALLSAAQLHGAAHQRPQVFQVMVRRPRADIECGRVRVEFHVRKDLERAGTVTVNTPRGYLRVASPATTALELVGYPDPAGGLDNVATVLAELAEQINADDLRTEARLVPIAWSQRLGYLLEVVGAQERLLLALEAEVQERARRVAPLSPAVPRTGAPRAKRWLLAINAHVEPDL
jgi:predicted transcriptional regulator of viral defense system